MVGCAPKTFLEAPGSSTASPPTGEFTLETSKDLALAFVDDLLARRTSSALGKMEQSFRETQTEGTFKGAWDTLTSASGPPTEFKYKDHSAGSRYYLSGEVKPAHKFWFATITTKYQEGEYFTFVEVVQDKSRPAVAGFALVTFPQGHPESLR